MSMPRWSYIRNTAEIRCSYTVELSTIKHANINTNPFRNQSVVQQWSLGCQLSGAPFITFQFLQISRRPLHLSRLSHIHCAYWHKTHQSGWFTVVDCPPPTHTRGRSHRKFPSLRENGPGGHWKGDNVMTVHVRVKCGNCTSNGMVRIVEEYSNHRQTAYRRHKA